VQSRFHPKGITAGDKIQKILEENATRLDIEEDTREEEEEELEPEIGAGGTKLKRAPTPQQIQQFLDNLEFSLTDDQQTHVNRIMDEILQRHFAGFPYTQLWVNLRKFLKDVKEGRDGKKEKKIEKVAVSFQDIYITYFDLGTLQR
jgi:hypothetical protein